MVMVIKDKDIYSSFQYLVQNILAPHSLVAALEVWHKNIINFEIQQNFEVLALVGMDNAYINLSVEKHYGHYVPALGNV